MFDFSEYPVDSKYYDVTNKKVVGKIKDEFKGEKIYEFVALRNKMYSITSVDDKEISKAKGVNKKLRHEEYVNVLFNKKVIRHTNKSHRLGTYDVYKILPSCFDHKRYVLDDGINTLAYFHKDIKN